MKPPPRILSFLSLLVIFTLLPWQPAVSLNPTSAFLAAGEAAEQTEAPSLRSSQAPTLHLGLAPTPALGPTPTTTTEPSEPTSVSPYPDPGAEFVPTLEPVQPLTSTVALTSTLKHIPEKDAPLLLEFDDSYYGWNTQGGRLATRQAGTPANPTSLQDFEYDYDPVGNIDWIVDRKAGGTQTQTFHYDNLDRLVDAEAVGGTLGTYDLETYEYDASTGNLIEKAGVPLGNAAQSADCPNGALSKKHAVTSFGTSNTYCYDPNGNMVRRKIGTSTYTLSYDAENRLTGVSGAATASFVYTQM